MIRLVYAGPCYVFAPLSGEFLMSRMSSTGRTRTYSTVRSSAISKKLSKGLRGRDNGRLEAIPRFKEVI